MKNYKQPSSKQKIANVSSVNKCHKINTSFRVRKTEHMRSRQNVLGRSLGEQRWRTNRQLARYYLVYGTQIVSRKKEILTLG